MSSIFSKDMTFDEARRLFYKSIDGKSKEEVEKIKKEYYDIIPSVLKRDLDRVDDGWL